MRAITVYQPYASAIVWGLKHFECRSWHNAELGDLVIHAGKKDTPTLRAKQHAIVDKLCNSKRKHNKTLSKIFSMELPRGAVVGKVTVTEIMLGPRAIPLCDEFDLLLGKYDSDWWAWRLDYPEGFWNPIAYRGGQGFWEFPHHMLPT